MVYYIAITWISAIFIAVGAVGFISYHYNRRESITKIKENQVDALREQGRNILYVETLYNDISNDIAFDATIQKPLVDYKYQRESQESVQLQINNALGKKIGYYENFENIVFFSLDGVLLGARNYIDPYIHFKSYPWADGFENTRGESLWFPFSGGQEPGVFPIAKKVYSTQSTTIGEPIGYLLLFLKPETFLEVFHSAGSAGSILCVLDDASRIIISSDWNLVGRPFACQEEKDGFISFEGGTYLATFQNINDRNNWSCVALTDKAQILSQANLVRFLSIAICGILLAIFVPATILISRMITAPVNDLLDHFSIAEKQNTSIRSSSEIREFQQLFGAFNRMVSKIYGMAEEMQRKNELQKKLEQESNENQLRALQMQINPHFIYNTLDEINWVSLKNKDEAVSDMLVLLGEFLRSNIRSGGIYTTVEEELSNIEMFFRLAKIKYGEALDYMIDVEPQLYHSRILKLLLQPLVENAIKYGIAMTGEPELIRIWMGREEDLLVISVRDNSGGISQEIKSYIQDIWDKIEEGNKNTKGIGIYNIMRRLYLCYHYQCSFEVISSPSMGTEIVISIPFEEEKEEKISV